MRVILSWLKDYVDIRIPPESLAEKLTMAGLEVTSLSRVDQDVVMEIEVTPNRTDCLSMVGIAREVAAVTGKSLKLPKTASFRGISSLSIPIQIQDKKLCGRYLGRVIKNVHVAPSPDWFAHRLEMMGVRAVNNIVDITNFCLLELGQPLHAFDLDKLNGQKLIVRRAFNEEEIVTIDGVKRQLSTDMLVIADKQKAQAIAGVMGGQMSEVSENTKHILLESAYFQPLNIHNTSRKLGLATQSSYRFERGVDLEGVYAGSLRAIELIKKLARSGKRKAKPVAIGKLINKGSKSSQTNKVRLRFNKVEEYLGMQVPAAQVKEALRKLEFTIVRKSKEGIMVDVPSFRPDVTREADLIEEIARLVGYDKTPLSLTQLLPQPSYLGELELANEQAYHQIRQILSSLGLSEIMTYSLISRQALRRLESPFENIVTVRNPLSYAQEIMRPTLMVGMLNTLVTNLNRKNISLKLFELSRVYVRKDSKSIEELAHLCIGMAGKRSESWLEKSQEYSFFDLKGTLEALLHKLGVKNIEFLPVRQPNYVPGRCAKLMAGQQELGNLGEINKEVLNKFDIAHPTFLCELKLYKLLPYIGPEKKFIPLARFPAIERDISLIAPQEVRSGEVMALIKKMGRGLVEQVALFDQYFGEQISHGFRGLAYSIKYRSRENTLTAEEVDKLHGQIRQALIDDLKVQIR
ncbi:MAG: phenylalanine--tRNA ligase subunit beta [Candidatus Omnitrophica bacterium]|nr:phenylalanine--tRNA ligase subunit beta [Candidatus Omnitrophota bacterium]